MDETTPPSAGEIRALAHRLMTWAEHLTERAAPHPADPVDALLDLAELIRGAHRMRAEIFHAAPLGNANWDVLLELTVRELNGYRTSLDHLALDGALPAAAVYTAVEALAAAGLVERSQDRFDARVSWLATTEQGKRGMLDWLGGLARMVRPRPGAELAPA